MNIRPCIKCGSTDRGKPRGAGKLGDCKPCSNRKNRARWALNKSTGLYKKSREALLAARLKSTYGISPEKYREMLDSQTGLCAICNTPEERNQRLSVDHCHNSGKVRGLLCNNCNVMLGYAKDSPVRLASAISYLQAQP